MENGHNDVGDNFKLVTFRDVVSDVMLIDQNPVNILKLSSIYFVSNIGHQQRRCYIDVAPQFGLPVVDQSQPKI